MSDQTADVDKNVPPDIGVENFSLKELFPEEYSEEIFRDKLRALMRDKSARLAHDHIVKEEDMRPGRSYYLLQAAMEDLTIVYGSVRAAADCLVLSAVRAGGVAIERQNKQLRLEWEKSRNR